MGDAVKILLVDGEPSTFHLVQHCLADFPSGELLTASNTNDAMRMAIEHLPGVIIADRYAPGEDGVTFCTKVRTHPLLSGVKFIMLTTAAGPDEAVRVFEAGADDYVAKPFHPEELASRIRSLLRIRALQDELKERREELELANQMLNADLEGVADLLLNIVSLRVPDAHIRGERARSLARWIGERLEMTGADVRAMDLAARLHEIGKIVMPDEIILKPLAQLSASDRETLAQFPLFGQMLIGSVRPLRYVERVLRHQLENYDGTGQPDRLMKGEIPLASRILRVVNFLEDHEDGAKREPAGIIEALRNAKGVILDPMLEQLSEEFILVTEHSSWLEGKRAVKLEALSEGMVIAADIFTGSGVKLLHEGSALTRSQIDRVVAYHRTDPVVNRIYIYQDDVPREQEGGA